MDLQPSMCLTLALHSDTRLFICHLMPSSDLYQCLPLAWTSPQFASSNMVVMSVMFVKPLNIKATHSFIINPLNIKATHPTIIGDFSHIYLLTPCVLDSCQFAAINAWTNRS